MERITVENYESFFLDYIEGRLNNFIIQELELFLENHPELRTELEETDQVYLEPESFNYEGKSDLKKFNFKDQPVNKKTFTDFCIASHENILPESKSDEFLNYLQQNPQFLPEYIAFGKAYLKPEIIAYPDRKKLYHDKHVIWFRNKYTYAWLAAAASAAIFAGIYFGNTGINQIKPANKIIATVNPVIQPSVKKMHKTNEKLVTQNPGIKNKIVPVKAKTIFTGNPDTTNKPEREILPVYFAIQPREITIYTNIDKNTAINLTLFIQQKSDEFYSLGKENTEQEMGYAYYEGDYVNNRKLLRFIETGLKGINTVTNTNITLAHKENSAGQMESVRVKAVFFSYEWNRKKK